jgi:RNA polymerase sigma factor (sigma-70 family)
MTEIYIEISKLTDKFREMAYRYTKDKTVVNEAVQELMLYFLQANPDVIRSIYEKDGIEGITKYGAVALRRALTSPRSNFYYKYQKYYTHITDINYNYNSTGSEPYVIPHDFNYKNISNIPNQEVDNTQLNKLEKIDKVLDTLSWYDRELFKLYYYEGNTLDGLAVKTRISRNSLFSTIDKVRELLRKKLKGKKKRKRKKTIKVNE